VFLAYYDADNLYGLAGGVRIEGIRIPQLAGYLAGTTPAEGWPFELRLLRSQVLVESGPLSDEEEAFFEELREAPGDESVWRIYSDWLEERGRPRANVLLLESALRQASRFPVAQMTNWLDVSGFGWGSVATAHSELSDLVEELGRVHGNGIELSHDVAKSLVHVDEHLAQLCLHAEEWEITDGNADLFHQWVFFDDLWASAHADLANAILRYAARWDVLTPSPVADFD
jgi:uncharacterized protein (TIGR02996 family)